MTEHRQSNNRSQSRNRPNQRRSNGNNNQQRRKPNDVWREAPPLPPLERIVVSEDVGALIRSLGEPPLANATSAGSAFETVAERAAAIARALAVSADLLGDRDD